MTFKIGDIVYKSSGKPFKNGEKEDEIIEFTTNINDPKGRPAAKLKNSDTIVSLDMLKLREEI